MIMVVRRSLDTALSQHGRAAIRTTVSAGGEFGDKEGSSARAGRRRAEFVQKRAIRTSRT
jgi:hypothetical protein